ncbi:hypothetical protein Pse7367_1361 [Thalassoporum mexicanum PCC 7367]|uniref:hypothetical protein n=1 Tax=Thalassoporum mexicanum TaxID=3457544 RepID=UPI00029FDF4F|nr:hypothetical protein [Pseudanabaena sp. PCC 7367]AFY69653.1 hypothetical protein Pse7367_1361 [Pseudanabaena sp. PCC 7367]
MTAVQRSNRQPPQPRKGWIYKIDPKQLVLECSKGHFYKYDISGSSTVSCAEPNCSEKINPSRIERGLHPYIFWSVSNIDIFPIAYAIPLTSKDTFAPLPSTYPIRANQNTGLSCLSYALVNQFVTIDIECFKDTNNHWIKRLGGISKDLINVLEERLKRCLDIANNSVNDWFIEDSDPELISKLIISKFNQSQRTQIIEGLIDSLD